MNNIPWTEKPIFLTGVPKSGTSLLLALIDGHSKIIAFPTEPSYARIYRRKYHSKQHQYKDYLFGVPDELTYSRYISDSENYPKDYYFKGNEPFPENHDITNFNLEEIRKNIKINGLNKEEQDVIIDMQQYFSHLENDLNSEKVTSTKDLMLSTINSFNNALKNKSKPEFWAYKFPIAVDPLDEFLVFFNNFYFGKVIVIIRDPRAVLASLLPYMQKQWKTKISKYRKFMFLISELNTLEDSYLYYVKSQQEFSQQRIQFIFYENLVQKPKQEMQKICDFLNIKYENILSQPSILGVKSRVQTASMQNGDSVQTTSINKWEKSLSKFEILLIESFTIKIFQIFNDKYTLKNNRIVLHIFKYLIYLIESCRRILYKTRISTVMRLIFRIKESNLKET